jgi:hypothetical protein
MGINNFAWEGCRKAVPTMHPDITAFRSGSCRNEPHRKSHTYVETRIEGELYPMCGYGWNRSDGEAFSIFRGSFGVAGTCERCRKNLIDGKPPVMNGWPHKTKWL